MKDKLLTRNECKGIQIDLLNYLDLFCEKNNLRYFLAYGTLLGAVRHKGFIPWDDDIDVFLIRDDYDKLIQLLKNREFTDNIELIDGDMVNYFYPFAKLVDGMTIAKMEDNLTPHGLWIDIFPLDYVPNNKMICNIFQKKCFYLRAITIAMTTDFSSQKLGNKALLKRMLNLLASIIGKKNIFHYYNNIIRKYYQKTDYVGCLSSPYIMKEKMHISEFLSSTEIEFEGRLYKAPINPHKYLKKVYGNYLKLPPFEKRRIHSITAWRI